MAETEHPGEMRSSYRDNYTSDSLAARIMVRHPSSHAGSSPWVSCLFVLAYDFTLCFLLFAFRSTRTM